MIPKRDPMWSIEQRDRIKNSSWKKWTYAIFQGYRAEKDPLDALTRKKKGDTSEGDWWKWMFKEWDLIEGNKLIVSDSKIR